MPRIDLVVPFHEKDEAKKLGARWDPQKKVWFVPDGTDAGTTAPLGTRITRHQCEIWEVFDPDNPQNVLEMRHSDDSVRIRTARRPPDA